MNAFWIVDSRKLQEVSDAFYGWTIDSNRNVIVNSFPDVLDGTGSYSYIKKYINTVEIGQDFLGTHCLCMYNGSDFCVVSNSFFKLLQYLKNDGIKLTFNKDFGLQYLYCNEEPFSLNDTLVNEIKIIDNGLTIAIDQYGNIIELSEKFIPNRIEINEDSIVNILDKWYEKWIDVFRNLAKTDYHLILDLSGGLDTRIAFGMYTRANIDRNRVIINSYKPKTSKYEKTLTDWIISKKIVNDYGYNNLNTEFCNDVQVNEEKDDTFETYYLGMSKKPYYSVYEYNKPVYHITGEYGGRVHGSFPFTPCQWCDHITEKLIHYFYSQEDYEKFLLSNAKSVKCSIDEYGIKEEKEYLGDFLNLFYKRFYGKKMLSKTSSNDICLSPFMDPMLHSLKNYIVDGDKEYNLSVFIIERYFYHLIDYTIEGGRLISNETKRRILELSDKVRYHSINYEKIDNVNNIKPVIKRNYNKSNTLDSLYDYAYENKDLFLKYYNEDILYCGMDFDEEDFYTTGFFIPIVSIIKVLKEIDG